MAGAIKSKTTTGDGRGFRLQIISREKFVDGGLAVEVAGCRLQVGGLWFVDGLDLGWQAGTGLKWLMCALNGWA